jgi:hypothetical protein
MMRVTVDRPSTIVVEVRVPKAANVEWQRIEVKAKGGVSALDSVKAA